MGTLAGRSGEIVKILKCRSIGICFMQEIVKILKCRSINICFVQETRFKGKSVRMIKGRAAQFIFWLEN